MCEHANQSATNRAIYCLDCGEDLTLVGPPIDHRYYTYVPTSLDSFIGNQQPASDSFSQARE